jgi:hypothetical protein
MPSVVFADLVGELVSEQAMIDEIESLVSQKAKESEQSMLEVPLSVYHVFVDIFESLDDGVSLNSTSSCLISNQDFRLFLNECLN